MTMKAVRYYGREDIRLEDIPVPKVEPGTVKIKIAWCGICGTDLHEYLDGPIFAPKCGCPHVLAKEEPPVTLGHEMSGTIDEVGEGVTGFKTGENVVVEPYFVCGECQMCKEGSYHLCKDMGFRGLSGGGGGLSEYIVVPTRWVHKIGDIPLDEAALIEPLSVAYHAVSLGHAEAGHFGLVGGAGPIGLLIAAVLKGLGIKTILSELSEARKQMAIDSGVADYVLDPSKEKVADRVREITGGLGAHVSFECTSVNPVLDMLIDATRPTGTIVNVSIWGRPATIDMQKLVLKELVLRGSIAYRGDHEKVIALLKEGKINVKPFITGRIALQEVVSKGFDALLKHKEKHVKIIVQPEVTK